MLRVAFRTFRAPLTLLAPALVPIHPASAINIDPKADIHPTAVLMGNVTVGPYTKIGPKVVIQGDVTIGHHVNILGSAVLSAEKLSIGNYVRIDYGARVVDGRPAAPGITANSVADALYIRDNCWVGMNATVRGARVEENAAVGNDAVADFNTHLENGAILAHGAVTFYDTVIPSNALAEGNPARVTKQAATDADRQRIFGLIPARWMRYEHDNIAKAIDQNRPKVQKSYPGVDGRPYWGRNVKIDPTAKVHPTVILVGSVTIGAYTRVGPGVVLSGTTIGHHCDIRANVNIRGPGIDVGNYVFLGERIHVGNSECLPGIGGHDGVGETVERKERRTLRDSAIDPVTETRAG